MWRRPPAGGGVVAVVGVGDVTGRPVPVAVGVQSTAIGVAVGEVLVEPHVDDRVGPCGAAQLHARVELGECGPGDGHRRSERRHRVGCRRRRGRPDRVGRGDPERVLVTVGQAGHRDRASGARRGLPAPAWVRMVSGPHRVRGDGRAAVVDRRGEGDRGGAVPGGRMRVGRRVGHGDRAHRRDRVGLLRRVGRAHPVGGGDRKGVRRAVGQPVHHYRAPRAGGRLAVQRGPADHPTTPGHTGGDRFGGHGVVGDRRTAVVARRREADRRLHVARERGHLGGCAGHGRRSDRVGRIRRQ